MAEFYTLLTKAGIDYENDCKEKGLPIKLSKFSVGDGGGSVYSPDATAVALKREVWRGDLSDLYQDEANPSYLMAEVTIPDDVGGWYVREAGIWTDTGILYAVIKYPESFKPILAESGAGKEFYLRAIFETSNASIVTLIIDESVVKATRSWVTSYVAGEIGKLDGKKSVRVATTANVVLSGAQNVDGVAVIAGDRVLAKNQTVAKDNGLYVVANGPWVRVLDADTSLEVTPGLFVGVEEGAANADTIWQLVTNAPIVLGATALAFEMVSGKTGVSIGTYFGVTVDKYGRVLAGLNPTTLAGYGITDAYTKAEIAAMIAQSSSLPTGSMVPFPVATVPPGFLEVNGDLFQDSVYPELAAFLNKKYNLAGDAAGWTRLPDSRGEFFRGWDHGRGADAGRALGSWQKGTFHSVGAGPTADSVTDYASVTGATAYSELGLDDTDLALYPMARAGNAGGAGGTLAPARVEISYGVMRPRNLSVMWCIKAWGAAINQGNVDVAALAALVGKTSNDIEVTIVYPGGGDASAPGTVARSLSYVVPNPFPGRKVRCQLELYYNSQWIEVYQNSSDDNYYGGIAGQQYDGDIRVVTASLALLSSLGNRGTFPQHMYVGTLSAHITAALPARVWVWKTKGVI